MATELSLTRQEWQIAGLVAWPRSLLIEDRLELITYFQGIEWKSLSRRERMTLEGSFWRFVRMVERGLLPQCFSDYDSDAIVRATLRSPGDVAESWRFLHGFLTWLVERRSMHPTLRVLWQPPHLWRRTLSTEARQEVAPLLETLTTQIGDATNIRSLRSMVFLLAKTVTCRTTEELCNWPLSSMPTHPSPAYRLEASVENIFFKWQRLLAHFYPEDAAPEDRFFFPSFRDGSAITPKISWMIPIEETLQGTALEPEHSGSLLGSLTICWGAYPELFRPFMEALEKRLDIMLQDFGEA